MPTPMKRFTRLSIPGAVLVVVLLAGSTAAYGFWTVAGEGNGTATTGVSGSGLIVRQVGSISALSPSLTETQIASIPYVYPTNVTPTVNTLGIPLYGNFSNTTTSNITVNRVIASIGANSASGAATPSGVLMTTANLLINASNSSYNCTAADYTIVQPYANDGAGGQNPATYAGSNAFFSATAVYASPTPAALGMYVSTVAATSSAVATMTPLSTNTGIVITPTTNTSTGVDTPIGGWSGGKIYFNTTTSTNQDACQGATVTITYTAVVL